MPLLPLPTPELLHPKPMAMKDRRDAARERERQEIEKDRAQRRRAAAAASGAATHDTGNENTGHHSTPQKPKLGDQRREGDRIEGRRHGTHEHARQSSKIEKRESHETSQSWDARNRSQVRDNSESDSRRPFEKTMHGARSREVVVSSAAASSKRRHTNGDGSTITIRRRLLEASSESEHAHHAKRLRTAKSNDQALRETTKRQVTVKGRGHKSSGSSSSLRSSSIRVEFSRGSGHRKEEYEPRDGLSEIRFGDTAREAEKRPISQQRLVGEPTRPRQRQEHSVLVTGMPSHSSRVSVRRAFSACGNVTVLCSFD